MPVVHVDEYSKPADERAPMFRMAGYGAPPVSSYERFDACRNTGHESYLEDGAAPAYEGELSLFDQLYLHDPHTVFGHRPLGSPVIPRETYAVARLLEKKLVSRDRVQFTADLHETGRKHFAYATLVHDPALLDAAAAATAKVGERFATQEPVAKQGPRTFSGFSHALGIDGYTIEGSPFDGDGPRPLTERVEQQLMALDTLLERYLVDV